MLQENLIYNPQRDLCKVSQVGFIDLTKAFASGVVPDKIADSEASYNGIEDPASILGKPSDVFEALEMESYIKSAGKTPEKDSANS